MTVADVDLRPGHAVVVARIERGELERAAAELRALIAAARRSGPHAELSRLWLTQAWIDLDRGRLAASERHVAAALPGLSGRDRTRARCLTGLHHCAAGTHDAAVGELSRAIPALRRHGDRRWLANALVGRGTAAGYLGRLREADADFAEAEELYRRSGEGVRAAACVHNRGFVALRAGDLPLALRLFDEAETAGLRADRHPEILVDQAQALVAAGLMGTARPVLARAATLLAAAGRDTKLAEATLAAAQCALRAGSHRMAVDLAAGAALRFGRQGRTAWRALARAVEVTARLSMGSARVDVVNRVATRCDRHGWWLAAAELRLAAADRGGPEALLAAVAARHDRGPAGVRALGWLATARLARNRRAVFAACRAGLRAVEADAAGMGAWELRAAMSGHTVALAALGLRAALSGGRPRTILRWTDRYRAVAGDRPVLLPPADPVLAGRLVALRSAVASGAPPRRVHRLEQQVRARDLARGGLTWPRPAWEFAELADRIGDAALLSLFVHCGQLMVGTFVAGRCRIWELGKASAIDAAVRSTRLGATVAICGGQDGGAALRSATELDGLLFGPVRRIVGDRPLVVVPAGDAHAVPWAALPSCAGRPVSVAPSIAGWLAATRIVAGPGEPVWIAGPRLRHAAAEARSLHGRSGGTLLTGRRATVAAAMAAMDGAGLAHIAAHGRFRADQPLCSGVELADGPLFGYDVQRLERAPALVVLSACEAGLAVVRPGGEVIGLATALLRSGTATVIASVLPVPDRRAVGLVTTLHEGLLAGLGPSAALANAQARHGHLGFVCFGAG